MRLLAKLRTRHQSNQRGFTLIELIIVVAILGLLAGVSIPNVGGFIKTNSLNAANTELENVKTASVATMLATRHGLPIRA